MGSRNGGGRRFAFALTLAVFAFVSGEARASTQASQAAATTLAPAGALGVTPLPGGVAPLGRLLGLRHPARGWTLLEVIRRVHATPVSARTPVPFALVPRTSPVACTLLDYLATVRRLGSSRTPPGGWSLEQASSPAERDALERWLDALGLTLEQEGGKWEVGTDESARARTTATTLTLLGIDRSALAGRLMAGERIPFALATDDVPLPLAHDTWRRVLGVGAEASPTELSLAILERQDASLLYYGLMGLDTETRAWLEAYPKLLEQVLRRSAGVFAAFGPALRVKGGVVQVPGGAAQRRTWAALVGAHPDDAGAFVRAALEDRHGMVAWLLDALAQVPAGHAAFALGAAEDSGPAVRLRDEFARAAPRWDVNERPFSRPQVDPAVLLAQLRLAPDGRLAGPRARGVWERVFAGDEIETRNNTTPIQLDALGATALDAAALVAIVFRDFGPDLRLRYDTLLFGNRALDEGPPGTTIQVLRGFRRFPALLLTLERLGIRDLDTLAALVTLAARVENLDPSDARDRRLAQLQGTLAIIVRCAWSGTLDHATTVRLLTALTGLRIDGGASFGSALAQWIESVLAPTVRGSLGADGAPGVPVTTNDVAGTLDSVLIDGIAHVTRAGDERDRGGATLEWEGQPYRIDFAGHIHAQLTSMRAQQDAPTLDQAVEVWQLARALSTARPDLDKARSELQTLRASLAARGTSGPDAEESPTLRTLDRALTQMERSKSSAKEAAAVVGVAADELLATSLLSLTYAASLGDVHDEAGIVAPMYRRHDFGSRTGSRSERRDRPWQLPARGETAGGLVTGSLLGLDLALAELGVRRIASDRLPAPPSLNAVDRSVVIRSVVLTRPDALTDAARDAIAGALRAGRQRVQTLGGHPADAPQLARDACLGAWRAQALAWSAEHEPDALPWALSRYELLLAGTTTPLPPDADQWGVLAEPFDGSLLLRLPKPARIEDAAGSWGTGRLAAQLPELSLAAAEYLAGRGLPAPLARGLLDTLTLELVDDVHSLAPDDWRALVEILEDFTTARFDESFAALVDDGPLVPISGGDRP